MMFLSYDINNIVSLYFEQVFILI